jgi:hypothetical protein
MAQHVQRKRFDHPDLAFEAAQGFRDFDPSIPGVKVTAKAREIDGEYWTYVTQEGDHVTGDEPLLPDYERVS